ncbi:MAG: nicotinate (nicotinamide) nucleotide adenylyltransferase [Verrucomicrobiales bacterium]|nr:nicotinate (nicotinamide) nucleotide adenylyltransferase [Verrucomicrobiales bacterium]
MKRKAIFGGTFDPVHLGHLELVKTAKAAANLDEVLLMPCWQSPFKGKAVASGQQRYDMLKLALENRDELLSGMRVSDYEILRPKPSYSWQTAKHFHDAEPDTEWWWILGTDQWNQLENWAQPESLRTLLRFIVLTRDGDEIEAKEGWHHIAVPFSHPASSTGIRNDFEKYRHWLVPEVAEYCVEQSLYVS